MLAVTIISKYLYLCTFALSFSTRQDIKIRYSPALKGLRGKEWGRSNTGGQRD